MKALEWLKKVLGDSFTQAITKILSNALTVVIVAFLAISATIISTSFQIIIQLPLYIFIFLCLFALIGVFIPGKSIYELISKNQKLAVPTHVLAKVNFEDIPREWRSSCHYRGLEWHSDYPRVYCSIHNIKLKLQNYGNVLVSICPDCAKDKKNYYGSGEFMDNFGTARHGWESQPSDFIEEVENRLTREVTEKYKNN
jgi:hypothetical protein